VHKQHDDIVLTLHGHIRGLEPLQDWFARMLLADERLFFFNFAENFGHALHEFGLDETLGQSLNRRQDRGVLTSRLSEIGESKATSLGFAHCPWITRSLGRRGRSSSWPCAPKRWQPMLCMQTHTLEDAREALRTGQDAVS
jgi:hypothetical protein